MDTTGCEVHPNLCIGRVEFSGYISNEFVIYQNFVAANG
jgi:hypothetical protein